MARSTSWLDTTYQSTRRALAAPTIVNIVGAALVIALLLVPPIPWNIRITLYLSVLIWTILQPRITLYLMAFAVPWGSLDFISVSGLRLNSADILVGFLAFGWILSWGLSRFTSGEYNREPGRIPRYLILAIALFIGVMLLSLTVAISKKDSVKEIFKWLEFFVLVLLGASYLRTRKQIWLLIVCIVLAAITQAFFGYAQEAFNLGPASFIRSSALRVYGTFDQPNPYAGYLNMALVIVLALFLLGKDWLTRLLAGIAASLIGGAFALTQSRGGEVALIAALGFILLAGIPSLRVWMRIGIIGVLLIIEGIVAGIVPLSIFEKFNHFLGLNHISLAAPSTQDYSTAERLAHWIAGLRMYQAHPILGVGIGNYPDAYPNYYVTIFVNSLGQAHNYYINIAAETGTIGLVIYLFFVTAMLIAAGSVIYGIGKLYRKTRQSLPHTKKRIPAPTGTRNKLILLLNPRRFIQHYQQEERIEAFGRITNDRALAIGLMAALITVAVHNLVDDLYDHSLTNLLALLLIAVIRLGYITMSTQKSSNQVTHSPINSIDRFIAQGIKPTSQES